MSKTFVTEFAGIDLIAAGVAAADADAFAVMLASPQHQHMVLPLAEQKDRTHDASVEAAHRFIADPTAFPDRNTGEPDPMRPFYSLGYLNHTRDLPGYALLIIYAGVLDRDTARDLAVFAWRATEWPERPHTEEWRTAWTRLGFCSDTEDVTAPTEPVELYRGATPKFKRGMAWTDDRDRALWFASRYPKGDGFGQGRVYGATVEPGRVFARILGRSEDEWVIDTRRLPIRTLEVPR